MLWRLKCSLISGWKTASSRSNWYIFTFSTSNSLMKISLNRTSIRYSKMRYVDSSFIVLMYTYPAR
jgi:hypothetical protein